MLPSNFLLNGAPNCSSQEIFDIFGGKTRDESFERGFLFLQRSDQQL